jgi:hypothetical protein
MTTLKFGKGGGVVARSWMTDDGTRTSCPGNI